MDIRGTSRLELRCVSRLVLSRVCTLYMVQLEARPWLVSGLTWRLITCYLEPRSVMK